MRFSQRWRSGGRSSGWSTTPSSTPRPPQFALVHFPDQDLPEPADRPEADALSGGQRPPPTPIRRWLLERRGSIGRTLRLPTPDRLARWFRYDPMNY